MIVKALVKDYKHHKGFAIISASGAEWVQPTSSHEQGNPLLSGPVRVKQSVMAGVPAAGAVKARRTRMRA